MGCDPAELIAIARVDNAHTPLHSGSLTPRPFLQAAFGLGRGITFLRGTA